MKYANLWASCACLLLLQLEMGAARATNNRPSEGLYDTARRLGLGADGLEYIWRTGMPWVITNKRQPNDVTTMTYTLESDRRTITRIEHRKFKFEDPTDADIFLDPFLNPIGTGSSQAYFESWARLFSNLFLSRGFNGYSNPNNLPPPPSNGIPNNRIPSDRIPNERIPNERNPSVRPPNERPEFTPNRDESNSLWVPSPEKEPFVPLPTGAPSPTKEPFVPLPTGAPSPTKEPFVPLPTGAPSNETKSQNGKQFSK